MNFSPYYLGIPQLTLVVTKIEHTSGQNKIEHYKRPILILFIQIFKYLIARRYYRNDY